MRSRLAPALVALAVVLAAACGSDDDAGDDTDPTEDVAEDVAGDTADAGTDDSGSDESTTQTTGSGDDAGDDSSESGDDAGDDSSDEVAPPAGGQGSATLTLDNGESYEFSVLCTLEPQTAAGSEILFTATSYDDPGLDITQFGDEGTITGVGSVSVYDGNFEPLWGASTVFEAFGGSLELTLDGSTIRGTGTFYPEEDPAAGEGVAGEVVANC